MKPLHCQLLRLVTGFASIVLVSTESPLWVVAVAPWAALCIFGILATIPFLAVIGMVVGGGAFQADAMSDGFVIGLGFVTPTVLAIVMAGFYQLICCLKRSPEPESG